MEPAERERSFDQILHDLERKEAEAGRQILLWTLLPALAGILLLAASLWAVRRSSERVEELRDQEASLSRRLEAVEVDLLSARQDLSEAREDLEGAREAVRFVQSGINLFHAGRHAEAVQAYEAALELDPENPYVVNLKGYALLRAGRLEESVEALRQAVEIAPDYAWGYFDLARSLCRTGKFDEARDAAKEALQLRPGLRAQMSQDGEFRRYCRPILDDILQ